MLFGARVNGHERRVLAIRHHAGRALLKRLSDRAKAALATDARENHPAHGAMRLIFFHPAVRRAIGLFVLYQSGCRGRGLY